MSDAQIVLTFVLGDQPTTVDDKKTALTLAKERGPEVSRIADAEGNWWAIWGLLKGLSWGRSGAGRRRSGRRGSG